MSNKYFQAEESSFSKDDGDEDKTTQKQSQASTTNDNPEDPSETACNGSITISTAVDETPSTGSSMTEGALREETEQPLDKNDGESNVVRGGQQHNEPLAVAAESTDEVAKGSEQETTPSSPPTSLAIERSMNIAHPSNISELELQQVARMNMFSHHAQAQAQSSRIIPAPNEQLPQQQSLFPVHPLISLTGIPLATVPPAPPPPTSLHSSLLVQLQLSQALASLPNNLSIFPPSPVPQASSTQMPLAPSLLGLPLLASLTQNFTAHGPLSQVTATQLQLASLLASAGQTAGQANHGLYMQPSPLTLATAHLLDQQLAASSNHHVARQATFPSQLIQSHEHTNRIEQLVAMLLSQQQLGITNTFSTQVPTPSLTNQGRWLLRQLSADTESNPRMAHVAIPAASAIQPHFLHSIPNPPLDNAMIDQRFGTIESSPSILQQLGSQASAPASTSLGSVFLHTLPSQLARNPTLDHRLYADQEAISESSPGPSHTKEKRWMMRYEELKQFQEVRLIASCNELRADFV